MAHCTGTAPLQRHLQSWLLLCQSSAPMLPKWTGWDLVPTYHQPVHSYELVVFSAPPALHSDVVAFFFFTAVTCPAETDAHVVWPATLSTTSASGNCQTGYSSNGLAQRMCLQSDGTATWNTTSDFCSRLNPFSLFHFNGCFY